jgi:hypothetical protein
MGTLEEAFKKLEPAITAIRKEEIIKKTRSTSILLEEISQLAATVIEDREQFLAIPRFDSTLIDTFQDRIDAYFYSYTKFSEIEYHKNDTLTEWNAMEKRAFAIRKRALSRLRILAEESNNIRELTELKQLTGKRGRDNLTLAFLKLSEKVAAQREELLSLNFSEEDITEVETVFATLKTLLPLIDTPHEEKKRLKFLMQQAYTYLILAERVIKKYGAMLFEDTKRAEVYKSSSFVQRGKQKGKS